MRTNQNQFGGRIWHSVLLVLLAAGLSAFAMQDNQPQDLDEEAALDWLKYCVACPQHDVIDSLAGVWTTTIRTWTDQSSEPHVHEGEAEYRWKLGGRYLMGELNCYVQGVEKHAIHILGYDNFRGEYQDVWLDNSTTAFQSSTGDYDEENSSIVWKGKSDNVVEGVKDQRFRHVTRFVSHDEVVCEMYRQNAEMEFTKRIEITFIRAD